MDVWKLRQDKLSATEDDNEVLQCHAGTGFLCISQIYGLHAQASHNLNGYVVANGRNLLEC